MSVQQSLSRWFFYGALLPTTLALSGWQGWLWWSWALSPAQLSAAAPARRIQVPQGTATHSVGVQLEAAGLIRSSLAWDVWMRWLGLNDRSGSVQAGLYNLSPSASLPDIAQQIWQGEMVTSEFTIPEGWSLRQMGEYFQSQSYFSQAEFLAATLRAPDAKLYADYPWLPKNLSRLEGYLFPDTYQAAPGQVTPEAVIRQMLDRFEQAALPVYERYAKQQEGRDQKTLSLQQWVTLASIVEKEAVQSQERPMIAGVFRNRLAQGMPLGADPTVEYGLNIRQTADQPLTFKQVGTPNPYNTYLNQGLPPTPIASPGLASLEATLYPQQTEYLYFVARYDGTHVFSRTLQEHEAAQATIRDQYSPSAATGSPAASPPPQP